MDTIGSCKQPFRIMGAGGTKDMIAYLQKAYQAEIFKQIRAAGYEDPMVIAKDLMTFEIGYTISFIPFEERKFEKK